MEELHRYAKQLFEGHLEFYPRTLPDRLTVVGYGGISYVVVTFGELFDTWDFQTTFRECRNLESVKRSLRRIRSGQMRLDLAK